MDLQGHLQKSQGESHSVVSDSLQPHGLYSPWNSPGQNIGVGSLSLLQGIFPPQQLNPGLPHCRLILYQLSPTGSHKGHPQLRQKLAFVFPHQLIVGCRQSLEGDVTLGEAVSDARVVPRGNCCQRLRFPAAEEGKLLIQRKLGMCILITRVIYDVLFSEKNKFQRHVCSIIPFSENEHLCYFCKFLVCLNLERKLSSLYKLLHEYGSTKGKGKFNEIIILFF